MPSLAQINAAPVPKLGFVKVGNIYIKYRRNSEGDCEPIGAQIDPFDGTDRAEETDPEKIILMVVSAMLEDEQVDWKFWLEDRANTRLERLEGPQGYVA